ncbi:MAG: hypothetical protein R3183_12505 [Oleiphilaceae bacterium]|nr:hypothetical protein [Oleiphilaceae bacterium]
MRLILSRKGFDSASGGCPNPVLPDGRLLALPIPDQQSPLCYGDIHDELDMALLASQLTGKKMRRQGAHLDPDLIAGHRPRHPDWLPVLGQHGSAEGHLQKQGVKEGDLFLFFGLFRPVERVARKWRFVPGTRARHCLWGWLQIGQVIDLSDPAACASVRDRYSEHPHLHGERSSNNRLYVARQRLSSRFLPAMAGAGQFRHLGEAGSLSDPAAAKPSQWRLPRWFFPDGRRPLSYHQKQERWSCDAETCYLQAVARGQEFVLHLEDYPEAYAWCHALFAREQRGPAAGNTAIF